MQMQIPAHPHPPPLQRRSAETQTRPHTDILGLLKNIVTFALLFSSRKVEHIS